MQEAPRLHALKRTMATGRRPGRAGGATRVIHSMDAGPGLFDPTAAVCIACRPGCECDWPSDRRSWPSKPRRSRASGRASRRGAMFQPRCGQTIWAPSRAGPLDVPGPSKATVETRQLKYLSICSKFSARTSELPTEWITGVTFSLRDRRISTKLLKKNHAVANQTVWWTPAVKFPWRAGHLLRKHVRRDWSAYKVERSIVIGTVTLFTTLT